jgi:heparin binding hemagglutinin HbhA
MSQPQNENEQPQQQPGGDLASELRELGQQIEAAVRSAIQSDKAKQLQQDVSSGMKEIGSQLQAAIKSIQDNPQFQGMVERGEQAVSQAQQSKAAQDFKETLARGVAQLNEQLSAFISRMNQPVPPAQSPTPDEGPAPATGETTRLDPDK